MVMSNPTDDYLSLLSRATSEAARTLLSRVYTDVTTWEAKSGKRNNTRGPKTAGPFLETLERFVGDLLRAHADPECTGTLFRSLSKANKNFSDDVVSYRNLKAAVDALSGLKLITHTPGQGRFLKVPAFGIHAQHKARASRFKATKKLLSAANASGVPLHEVDDHFRLEAPRHPLVLKAASRRLRATKYAPQRMDYETTDKTRLLEAEAVAINEFLSGFTIRGGTHYGFVRIFNDGDQRGFDWQWGGRLYSIGERNYQQLSGEQRALMTINDEPVVELDVRASNLTIFHALIGEDFDTSTDPYGRVELDRDIVKAWSTISFGADEPVDYWPEETVSDFAQDGVDLKAAAPATLVRDRMLATYPVLKRLGDPGVTWRDLMFAESSAVIGTMMHLNKNGVPCLPVHDSIIVPASKAGLGAGLLHDHYNHHTGASPWIKTDSTLPGVQEEIAFHLRKEKRSIKQRKVSSGG
jgi:hypothetical protein